jgi:menaquinol-cytochrome c reductase iron-sulfur subunit
MSYACPTDALTGFVYITKEPNNELLVLSPTCSHLGCNVPFATDEERKSSKNDLYFKYPCHGGEYDRLGKNIAGPPPRPLDTFKPLLKDRKIYIDIFSSVRRK